MARRPRGVRRDVQGVEKCAEWIRLVHTVQTNDDRRDTLMEKILRIGVRGDVADVRVRFDESRRDNQARGIDDGVRAGGLDMRGDPYEAITANRDVKRLPRRAAAIDQRTVLNDNVVRGSLVLRDGTRRKQYRTNHHAAAPHTHQKKYRRQPVTSLRRIRHMIASPEIVSATSESAQNIAPTRPPSPSASPLCRRIRNGLST